MTTIPVVDEDAPVAELDVDYVISDEDHDTLVEAFASITANPYRQYEAFTHQVRTLVTEGRIPAGYQKFCQSVRSHDRVHRPVVFIKNMPIDKDVPVFDHQEPVRSKYELKKTFIGEASLALFGILMETPPIGYVNVNDGDVFQDIYPKASMASTQSQKASGEIFFHKDLANHFVRPDYVYMLGMRSTPVNKVYTSFVRNIDALAAFTPEEIELLRQPLFYTPFDDLTVMSGNVEVGEAPRHPLFSGENDIRFFENRTRAVEAEHQPLVDKLARFLHETKKRVLVGPGDFMSLCNNDAVHAKEVVSVGDPEALKSRWIMKTVNVDEVEPHQQHLVPGTDWLVNG